MESAKMCGALEDPLQILRFGSTAAKVGASAEVS
jgi:hypothetical protein